MLAGSQKNESNKKRADKVFSSPTFSFSAKKNDDEEKEEKIKIYLEGICFDLPRKGWQRRRRKLSKKKY
jgi:hypothetical protein